ncbi:MAG: DUF424 family protein [Halobacteriota archaeon]
MLENEDVATVMTMCLKSYSANKEILVAVCDSELVGRTFCEGELHLYVNEDFFKGQPADEHEVKKALEEATIANLVGERSVTCGIDSGVVDENCVIIIEGVPHAQMVLF